MREERGCCRCRCHPAGEGERRGEECSSERVALCVRLSVRARFPALFGGGGAQLITCVDEASKEELEEASNDGRVLGGCVILSPSIPPAAGMIGKEPRLSKS